MTVVPPAPRWAAIPPARSRPAPLLWLAAWLVGALPVLAQLDRLDHPAESIRRAGGLVLIAAALVSRRPRAALPVAVATAAVLMVDRSIPAVSHALLVGLVGCWMAELGAIRHRWITPVGRTLAAPFLVATAALLLFAEGVRGPVVAAAGAAVGLAAGIGRDRAAGPAAVLAPVVALGRRLARANGALLLRLGRPVGTALGAVAMLPGAALVAPAWVGNRIARVDAVEAPARAGSRWVVRNGLDPAWDRSFGRVAVVDPAAPDRRRRRALAAGVVLLLIAVPVAGAAAVVAARDREIDPRSAPVVAPDDGSDTDPDAPPRLATQQAELDRCLDEDPVNVTIERQPGARRLACELRAFVSRPRFDASTVFDYPDFAGRWVRQVDGKRRTWRPPACECRRLRVWWFGGSAAWGWNQRDEHSLPSQLARAAARRGFTLDIENLAMPAWVLGQEVRRFQSLLETEEPPDLVIFYDGGNELNRQKERAGRGIGSDESPTSFLEAELGDFLWRPADDGVERPAPADAGTPISPEAIARHALARYGRDVELARRIGEDHGLDPVFVWQPLRHTSSRAAAEADAIDPKDDVIWRRMAPAAAANLPRGVVDLSGALADVDHPVFEDFYHHNEEAASTVAEDLLDRLTGRLTAAQEAAP